MRDGEVDVVIAIHDARRDIARSAGSALTSSGVARVVIVCHHLDPAVVADRLGALAGDPRIALERFDDGLRSPAGPFNRGLDLADARFTAIMGSDDELSPGAIDRWLEIAHRDGADVVVPVLRYAGGRRVPTPPTRPMRRNRLDGVRDRLAYRTAPLGLVARQRFGDLRMTPGLATGEDLRYSTMLWFSDAAISRVRSGAEYLIHDDAERVTFTARPVRDELAAIRPLLDDGAVAELPPAARTALAVKLWRITLFGAVHHRAGGWGGDDRAELAAVAGRLRAFAPRALDVLSRADRSLVAAVEDPAIADVELDARSRARRRFATPAALLTADLPRAAAREAPLRFAAATWLAGRG